jgi:hypothetical protein
MADEVTRRCRRANDLVFDVFFVGHGEGFEFVDLGVRGAVFR